MSWSSDRVLKHLPPEEELEEEFVRTASGPGGQNVNKTAVSVRLTFRFMESSSLSACVKAKLSELCSGADFISFLARGSRSLPDNRLAARLRLAELIAKAKIVPKKRKKTSPTRASKERRLEGKSRRSVIKSARRKVSPE